MTTKTNETPTTQAPSGAPSAAPMALLYSRFSSEKQADGASLARQTEAAKRYCEANGLILSEERFHDAGVSAYHGRNVEEGELGRFLDLVRSGVIPRGSVLIIENNDRLSRMNHRKAARLFEDILETGVEIVTLSDGRRYSIADLERDPLLSVMIILTAARAHEESRMKAIRVADAWRRNAQATKEGKRIRSSQAPHWLTLKGDLSGGEWIINEEAADLVREVFSRYAEGEGSSTIAKALRERGIASPRGGHWRGSSIIQLLRRESPFGRLEIGKGQDSAREVIDVVEGYFPRIVDAATEAKVKTRLAGEKPTKLGGRNSDGPLEDEGKTQRVTRGAWTGRLFREDGQRLKVKRYARTCAYVGQVDGKYLKGVSVLDGLLRDHWGQIAAAWGTMSSADEEDNEMAFEAAQDDLARAEARYEAKPSPATLRALEAEREIFDEIKRTMKEQAQRSRALRQTIPQSVEGMEVPEVNKWVRLAVEKATVGRMFPDNESGGVLTITAELKNGAKVIMA